MNYWYDEVVKTEQKDKHERYDPESLKPSQECLDLIEFFEGFRSEAYVDAVGVITIGYGSVKGVKMGDTITKEEAGKRMLQELYDEYSYWVGKKTKVPLTQYEFDALSSFSYNCGLGAYSNSSLLKKLNKGDYEGVGEEFLKWNKGRVNGKLVVLRGLTRRRKAEKAMFEGKDWKGVL